MVQTSENEAWTVTFQNTARILSCLRRAVEDYQMIEEGDSIAVGLSGGKDSTALLCALSEMRRFYPKKYDLTAITVDMGFAGMDFTPLEQLCRALHIRYVRVESQIAEIVFDIRQEKNPCSLCAKLRRGALHDAAKENGCGKLALGHHANDAVETFVMNLLNEGRIGCFSPVTYLSRKDLTLIRPLLYANEKEIRGFLSSNNLPVVSSLCPADKHTDREFYKQLLRSLEKERKGLRHRIFVAMQKADVDGFRPIGTSAPTGASAEKEADEKNESSEEIQNGKSGL